MGKDKTTRGLGELGLTGYETTAYLALLRRASFTPSELSLPTGIPRQRIYDVLDSLEEKGLSRSLATSPRTVAAIEPELALEALGRRRLGALGEEEERVRSEIAGLSPELLRLYREGTKVEGPLDSLEIYRDSGQIAALAHRLAAEATDDLRACFRDPSALSGPENGRLFKDALGRGVRCRVLVDSGASFARELGSLGAGFFGQGLEVRLLTGRAQLPVRMLIVDGSTGLVILKDPLAGPPSFEGVVVRHPDIVSMMELTFESLWEHREARGLDAQGHTLARER